MKLVDILARDLGFWPDGMGAACQMEDGRLVFSREGTKVTMENTGWYISDANFGCKSRQFGLAENFFDAIVTRAEWQAAVDALNAPKVVEWDGVGLPPVGLDVEIKRGNCTWIDGDEWQIGKTATVMASFLNSRDIEMASVQFPGGHCECILARCLSPIRTAEQVAAEEREKAIEDMLSLFEVAACKQTYDMRGGIAAIYDANYRKQVAK